MSIQVHVLPILSDNYVFAITDSISGKAAVVDPGEFPTVEEFLVKQKLELTDIFITHQHSDHIGGVSDLVTKYRPKVYAPVQVHKHLNVECRRVNEGDVLNLFGLSVGVLNVEGHTLGHVAYDFSELKSVFVGDVLFGLGCGRIFEGDYEMTFNSLKKIKALPEEYKVYCAHEYTKMNMEFVKKLMSERLVDSCPGPEDFQQYEMEFAEQIKSIGRSVPLALRRELKVNPFLLAPTCDEFAKVRMLRNSFKI